MSRKIKTIEIVIDDRLRIRLDSLSIAIRKELRQAFTHKNPTYYKMKALGFWTKESKEIKTWSHVKDRSNNWWLCLPRGGMQRIRDIFKEHYINWYAIDNRSNGDYFGEYTGDWVKGDIFPEQNLTLWNHQIKIAKAVQKYENCLVRAPTGSGKTSAVIYIVTQVQLSTIVIVWSTSLLKQWIDRVSTELGISKKEIGIIQGKRCKLNPFTIAMQQTLNQYTAKEWKNIRNAFGLVICDEVQRYAAATFTKTITRFNSKYRVGVSADERRRDKKEFLIYDMFGKVVEDIPHEELVAKKIIHNVELCVVPTNFRAEWYVDQMVENEVPDFNALMEEMIVDADRNEKIRSIITRLAKRGYRMIVFSQRVDHCRILDSLTTASGYRSGLFLGGAINKDLFEATRKGLMDGSRQVGIGTLSGGSSVGLDIPQVSHGILTTPIHNNKQFLNQVSGRLCRVSKDKTVAQLFVLWDQYIFGRQPLLNFKRWYSVVKVQDGKKWVDVKTFLKGYRDYAEEKRYQKGFGTNSPFVTAQTVRSGKV